MKKRWLIVAALLFAGMAAADEAPAPTKSARILKGDVVATDPPGRLTYKTDRGEEKTAAVGADAAERLRALKPGDRVILILREEGEEQTVVSLKKTAARKSPATP